MTQAEANEVKQIFRKIADRYRSWADSSAFKEDPEGRISVKQAARNIDRATDRAMPEIQKLVED